MSSRGRQLRLHREHRLQVVLADDLLAAVDDYRFSTRAPNRSTAIRELLVKGMFATVPHTPKCLKRRLN